MFKLVDIDDHVWCTGTYDDCEARLTELSHEMDPIDYDGYEFDIMEVTL